MSFRCIHILADGRISFFLTGDQESTVCISMHHVCFIHSSVDRHGGCSIFRFLKNLLLYDPLISHLCLIPFFLEWRIQSELWEQPNPDKPWICFIHSAFTEHILCSRHKMWTLGVLASSVCISVSSYKEKFSEDRICRFPRYLNSAWHIAGPQNIN